jgi:hypothetical protein
VTHQGLLRDVLARLVRDERYRGALAARRRTFVERYEFVQPPGAAERAADAIRVLAAAD